MPPAAVLCIGFNRPDLFARVLDAVGAAGPRRLFVAVDGPRPGRDADAVLREQVLRVAANATWPTQIDSKIAEENLGCGLAITSAVSWALSHVTELIVFEDDCLPDPSFLRFCDELLERYRDDSRVMQIAGTNWGTAHSRFGGNSYAFTSFAPVWGWATWRRAWELNDYALETLSRSKASGLVQGMALSPRFRRLLVRDWERVLTYGGTWDYQWQYAVLRNHGLSVIPARNLITNVGFREDGTQLTSPDNFFASLPLQRLEQPIRHPPEVANNASVLQVFERIYWQKRGWPADLFRRVIRGPRLNRLLRTAFRSVSRPS